MMVLMRGTAIEFYSGHLGQHTGKLDSGLMRTMHHGYLRMTTMWQTGAVDMFLIEG